MSRLKITGYVDTDDLDADWVDETNKTGLTEDGYEQALDHLISGPLGMHDIEIEVEE